MPCVTLPSRGTCRIALPLIVAALAVGQSTDAQPPDEVRVARLIRKLGSDDYTERRDAGHELARLGPAGRRQLVAASADTDPEIRLRAARLLRQLQIRDVWSPSEATLVGEGLSVEEALDRLAEQTGNSVLTGRGDFEQSELRLSLERSTFWEALDAICRQSGNHVRPHYDPRRAGLVLVTGPPGNNPLSYAGPLRAQIVSARRMFQEQFDYDQLHSEVAHTFQLNLQVMWEDRFHLVAYRARPEVVEAVTDDGVVLAASEPSATTWNVAAAGTGQLTTSLRLHPPPVSARKLRLLRLRWGLIAVGEKQTLEIDDLTPDRSHHRGDIEVIVQRLERRANDRWTLAVRIARDLIVPEPEEVLLHENHVELLDAEGRAFRAAGQENIVRSGGAELTITFAAPAEGAEPHRLRVTHPAVRGQRDVEIEFRDVPLPVARMEGEKG